VLKSKKKFLLTNHLKKFKKVPLTGGFFMTLPIYSDRYRAVISEPKESNSPIECFCSIIPPHISAKLATAHPESETHALYKHNHEVSDRHRAERAQPQATASPGGVLVYDAKNRRSLPGKLVSEPQKSLDPDVQRAYKYGVATRAFFGKFGRDSIDDKGMALKMTVNYRKDYDNAFWNGSQLIFGDGDPRGKYQTFTTFTQDVDIIAHEATHGVTQYAVPGGGLVYQGQSGALNESMSDVHGIQVKMFHLNLTSEQSNWLIGEKVLVDFGGKTYALRNMLKPGTAYVNHPVLGTDPQPAHMNDYLNTTEDNGGVHLNSGIPNRAFALTALELKGNAWEVAGKIWHLTYPLLKPTENFKEFAEKTIQVAKKNFGPESPAHRATANAWTAVGIKPN
jgi:Zn-dependent metalloprotease